MLSYTLRTAALSLLLVAAPCHLQAAEPAAPAAVETTQAHPFFRTSLYPAWSQMTHQQALVDVKAALEEARGRLAAIAAVTPETATFENTFLAWYRADENMKQLANYTNHLHLATGSPAIQRMMADVHGEIVAFKAEGVHARRIAEVLREASRAPWVAQLSPAKQRFVQQTVDAMRDTGLYLSPAQQERKAAIESELSRLGYRFSLYVKQAPHMWELLITDPAELEGMPPRWMQAAEAAGRGRAGEGKPAWLVNLTTAPASAVLRYCKVAETRRKCWLGTTSAGTPRTLDTEPLVARILELRHELATLLGYANYADMQAARRMMGSGEKALAAEEQTRVGCLRGGGNAALLPRRRAGDHRREPLGCGVPEHRAAPETRQFQCEAHHPLPADPQGAGGALPDMVRPARGAV